MTTGSALSAHRLLERGASELREAGVSEARFEAELLLRHALGCTREALFARLHEPAGAEAAGHYFHLLERRRGRVPIQHILGTQEFYGLSFRVTPSVLIPRPETELVVDEALAELSARSKSAPTIADVGCGSGCIAIAIARERPQATFLAIDASPSALAVARENAAAHGVDERITFLHGDLLDPLVERGEKLDLVVSNPPYVVDAEIGELAPEVKEHEPRMALAGGADGLATITRLLEGVGAVLDRGGVVVMEIGKGQDRPVAERVLSVGLDLLRIVPDLAGIPRVVVARKR
ncbi:MAG TPA: peptide chain release factor N(5)-glutamine methyltransferase [Vicinamibacteria bacterium]|nr:peptide chain release factor N(5)-glutamine methyltransferase [Vicinamibacteria bacterium]